MSTAPEKPSAPFNYTLRIVMAPGFHEEDNLRRRGRRRILLFLGAPVVRG